MPEEWVIRWTTNLWTDLWTTAILAAESQDPILQWVQYGVLGLVVLGFIMGWIWPRPSVDRLLNDIERQRVQLDTLLKVYQEQVIPTLGAANEVLAQANEMLARLTEHQPWDGTERRRGPSPGSPSPRTRRAT